jgi:hypothetical protein
MFKVKESDQVKLATIRIRFGLRLQYAGKMTMRDAQLIEKLFFRWYSIGYLTRGTIKPSGPTRGCGQYDINCTRLL